MSESHAFLTGVPARTVTCRLTGSRVELIGRNGAVIGAINLAAATSVRWSEYVTTFPIRGFRALILDSPAGRVRIEQRGRHAGKFGASDWSDYYLACASVLEALARTRPDLPVTEARGRRARWLSAILFLPALAIAILLAVEAVQKAAAGATAHAATYAVLAAGLAVLPVAFLRQLDLLRPTGTCSTAELAARLQSAAKSPPG